MSLKVEHFPLMIVDAPMQLKWYLYLRHMDEHVK
jgi:hypothetical protein